jgi:hypothetical protein
MQFFYTPLGKAALGIVLLGTLLLAIYQLSGFFGPSTVAQNINRRWLICTETEKPYQVDLASIREFPAHSPFSGKDTGQPAELCFWTADGQPKKNPTPVLLNSYRNLSGPTFCPDCGRLVVERNPGADPGANPPPTRADYESRFQR